MTDKKISELSTIAGAQVEDAADKLVIVDDSVSATKAITRAELFKSIGSVTASIEDDGTVSGGTYTPAISSGGLCKKIVNGGAFTLAPASLDNDTAGSAIVFVENNASAGAIDTSGFDVAEVAAFNTTDGNAFLFLIDVYDIAGTEYSILFVLALQ